MDLASFLKNHLFSLRNLSIFSFLSPFININSTAKYLKTALLAMLLLAFSVPVFATHNPTVSHSASSITNGTFLDDYSDLEVRL